MAIIPSNTRFVGISSSVDLVEKKSALVNKDTQPYTIEDIAQTVGGGGGGGLGDLVIDANGTLGSSFVVGYSVQAFVNSSTPGVNAYPVAAYPNISINGGSYGGTPFNATEISFPGTTVAAYVNFGSTPLQVISFPDLEMLAGSMAYFSVSYNQSLRELNMPSLVTTGNLQLSGTPNLQSVDFSSLETLPNGCNWEYSAITQITSAEFPVLKSINNFNVSGVTSINLPSLEICGYISSNNGSLISLNFPNLEFWNVSGVSFGNCQSLANVTFGTTSTLKQIGYQATPTVYNFNADFAGCSLTQASVDGILAILANLDGTNGTCNAINGSLRLDGGYNTAPSSAGLANAAILAARNWYVAYN